MSDKVWRWPAEQPEECKRQFELLRAECRQVLAELEGTQRKLANLRTATESGLHSRREHMRFQVITGGRA
jgi:hypothetical protein